MSLQAATVSASRPPHTRTERAPTDLLLHPWSVCMLAVLLFNDHYWKGVGPAWLTGKLSDVAFMLLAPVWLYVAGSHFAKSSRQRLGLLGATTLGTGLFFTSMQLSAGGDALYRWLLGALQWPFRSLASFIHGSGAAPLLPVEATPDPTDLLCLPFLALAWWLAVPTIHDARLRSNQAP